MPVNVRPFNKLIRVDATLELIGREKVIARAVHFALTRLSRGSGNRQAQIRQLLANTRDERTFSGT